MSVVYQNSFQSDTQGSIAGGWTGIAGSWKIGNYSPVAPYIASFAETNVSSAAYTILTSPPMGAIADMSIFYKSNYASLNSNAGNSYPIILLPIMRATSNGAGGYILGSSSTAGLLQWYKLNGVSTFVTVGSAFALPNGASFAGSGTASVRAYVKGTTLACKMWPSSGAEPSTWSSITDSSVTAAGYCGIFQGGAVSPGINGFTVDSAPSLVSISPPTAVPASATTITVAATVVGGTSPYTCVLYRSATSSTTIGTQVYSGTSASFVDTPPDGSTYFYRYVITDSASNVVTSQQVAGRRSNPIVSVGGMGDSLTLGYLSTSGFDAMSDLQSTLAGYAAAPAFTTVNRGIGGSTSSDWIPSNGNNYFTNAKAAIATAGCKVVQIELGINDASIGNRISVATYKSNIQAMVTNLTGSGYIVVLQQPTYIVAPQTINGTNYDEASTALIQQYGAALLTIANGTTVFCSDATAFGYFVENPNQLQDGVHPSAVMGYMALATAWAKPIGAAYYNVSSGGGTGYAIGNGPFPAGAHGNN